MSHDFSRQNLHGCSFKGKNLEGANFSYTDIRGADFSNAILVGANFKHAKAGLQRRWAIGLVILSLLLFVTSDFISLLFSFSLAFFFENENFNIYTNLARIALLLVSIVFSIFTVFQGLIVGLQSAVVVVAVVIVAGAVLRVGSFTEVVTGSAAGSVTGAAAGAASSVVVFISVVALAVTIATVVAGRVVAAVIGVATIGVAIQLVVVLVSKEAGAAIGIMTGTAIALMTGLAYYIANSALIGNKKHALIFKIAVVIAAMGGTSFCNADLKNANFSQATLENTNFKKALLTCTCWLNAQKLHLAVVEKTYLKDVQVQQLVVTKNGQDKNFERMDLRDVNLQEANLTDASFIDADLSGADLQDANLSRTKLVKTKLDSTDFTGATLTGAYVEDWGITSNTKFNRVRCDYVYMRLPTKENPNPLRKPDNLQEVFADGDFGDFIKPIVNTLDLYHSQGVDPRAIAISFKELAENNPDAELEIVAMERRGKDKFLLRAKTAQDVDKSQLSAEYFENYNQIKALAQQEVQALMLEKDRRIHSLEIFVNTALKRPNFYSNTSVEKVDNMNQPGGISQNMSGGTMYGGMQAAQADHNNQTMDTNVVSPQQKQNLAQAAAEIQALLEQLDKTYSTDTTKGKMELAASAIAQIDSNPTLTARILSALKVGSVKAFEQFLSHPAASFVIGALEDWQKTKEN